MSFRRYETLLPIRYNDGSPVEKAKHWLTTDEIVGRFDAATYEPQALQGIWSHEGRRFEDQNARIFVDVEDTPENEEFFRQLKVRLKERFRQLDIWIVSREIRIT